MELTVRDAANRGCNMLACTTLALAGLAFGRPVNNKSPATFCIPCAGGHGVSRVSARTCLQEVGEQRAATCSPGARVMGRRGALHRVPLRAVVANVMTGREISLAIRAKWWW
jgi:hypothetical protein